jgi:hypothetical protein
MSQDDIGNQSTASNTLTIQPGSGDRTPPTILSTPVMTPSQTSAVISWPTNESSTSVVEYGTTGSLGQTQGVDGLATDHSVTLVGLNFSTKYYIKVKSVDATGNSTEGTLQNFTTLPTTADTTAPTITLAPIASADDHNATITWSTNEPSSSFIEYGETGDYGKMEGSDQLDQSHSYTISNLTPSTPYHYRIKSTDSSGNQLVWNDLTFSTLADQHPVDTTPPTITSTPTVVSTDVSAAISWDTNENSDSYVEIGATTDQYSHVEGSDTLTSQHSIQSPI